MLEALSNAWRQSPLRRRYEALATRERYLAMACGAALGLALLYAGFSPLLDFRRAAIERHAAQESDLQWMQANRELAASPSRHSDRATGSQARLSTINAAAKEFGLPLRSLQPEADGFSVQVEGQRFDAVIRWSHALESRHGIEVVSASINVEDPGVVNARFGVR